jgi:hypoxanthine phosphoribosyltransferase
VAASDSAEEALAVRAAARQLYTAAQVRAAIDRMAVEASERLADKDPVVLAVMQGGAFAAIELCGRLRFPHRFDYVHLTRYGEGLTGGSLRWRVKPDRSLAGRAVLVVDDVIDHGVTLATLQAELRRIGVAELCTAALVVKDLQRHPAVQVDIAGLHVPDAYVFGSGMDYKGYWRGLAGLYAVPQG